MIVSHEYRFIFLKTRKTAGTSVEVLLSRIAGDDAIVTPIGPREMGHDPRNHEALESLAGRSHSFSQRLLREAKVNPDYCRYIPYFNHMPAWLVRSKLGHDIWNSYFKFCFERNPWDKVASIYGWRTRNLENPPPFNDWLFSDRKVSSDWPIYSIDAECAVDAVGRYEALNEDLDVFLERVGIASDGLDLPGAKSGFRREVRYPPACVEHVRRMFHREIQMFGYECPPELLM